MKELIEYIAKSIVSAPEGVKVTEEADDKAVVVVKLEVAPDDKGRVIGRQGRVAEAMRTLLRVVATREGVRARLEIV
ncbi:MAG TPA: KH domain-containing protein [Dehalococcoidia bacterium]|nr:KH domain-containing protein [Dehalococcoidia bacterium]